MVNKWENSHRLLSYALRSFVILLSDAASVKCIALKYVNMQERKLKVHKECNMACWCNWLDTSTPLLSPTQCNYKWRAGATG